jgi:tetratricopeptide (TPR) repeat protein
MTIRAFRLRLAWTQAQLAERWPGSPVNPQYVQRVERGKKRIADHEMLRRLAELLDIPLWRFGLSPYDPFSPHHLPGQGEHLYAQTLEAVECLIRQTWALRSAALMPNAAECLRRLNTLFDHFERELAPPSRLESSFLRLSAQVQRLNAVEAVECCDYPAALRGYVGMRRTAERLGEPATLAIALMSIGAELERGARKPQALDYLERARDASFGAGKHVAAFVHAYLARAYASVGDATRFERAAETAERLVEGLGAAYGDGTDFVYARPSSVLTERSWGYLALGQPEKALALRERIAGQIERDRDLRLRAWIPLDWARAYLRLGEIGASVAAARAFVTRTQRMGSPHAAAQAHRLLCELAQAGHERSREVQDLRELLEQRG